MSRFDDAYIGTPPWDIGRPQPALAALAEAGELHGRVLDAGCGTGEHALMAAALGLDATGVDSSRRAIEIARSKGASRALQARFVLADVLELRDVGAPFDTVVDCGCFHTFDDDERVRYVAALRSAVDPGGRLFLLCFSDRQPGVMGPRRVSARELRDAFADGWRVDAIEPAILVTNLEERGDVQAWLARITRVA
ncbi:MAG: class I SAM-dependent methyltransferase [Planctomycetaceae bacterium]